MKEGTDSNIRSLSLIRNGASAGRPGPLTYTCER